jgi:hypothetical protein
VVNADKRQASQGEKPREQDTVASKPDRRLIQSVWRRYTLRGSRFSESIRAFSSEPIVWPRAVR